jgi:hypothetical protein
MSLAIPFPGLRSHRNLKIDCTSNTQVVVKSGSVVSTDDASKVLTLASDRTLDITAGGVNGLDTGSEAANTWYYIYLIYNPATDTTNGLLSVSATSPTLPSGYTKKRLIGAVRNDGSSNFIYFKQVNTLVYIAATFTWRLLSGGTAGSLTAVDMSSYVPVTISAVAILSVNSAGTTNISFNSSTTTAQVLTGVTSAITLPRNGNDFYYSNTGAGAYIDVYGFILDL